MKDSSQGVNSSGLLFFRLILFILIIKNAYLSQLFWEIKYQDYFYYQNLQQKLPFKSILGYMYDNQHKQMTSGVIFTPISSSIIKTLLVFGIILALSYLSSFLSLKLSLLILLYFILQCLYLKIINHPLILTLFYQLQQQQNFNVNKYAIKRQANNKVHFVHTHYQLEKIKFLQYQGFIYQVEGSKICLVSEVDVLRYLSIEDMEQHLRKGLSQAQMKMSSDIFGYSKYTNLSMSSFMLKKLYQEIQWFIILLFLQILVLVLHQQLYFTIIPLLILNLSSFALILITCYKQSRSFQIQYESFYSKEFKVLRNKAQEKVKIDQILIGDVLQLPKTEEASRENYLVNFKSLLIGTKSLPVLQNSKDLMIKQGIHSNNFHKLSSKNVNKYIIQPFSYIERDSIKQSAHLLILDNRHIFRYLEEWLQKSRNEEGHSVQYPMLKSILKLYIFGIVAILVKLTIIEAVMTQSISFRLPTNILNYLSLLFLLFPSFLYFILEFNHFTAFIHLSSNHFDILTSNLASAGLLSNIHIDFQQISKLSFKEILYKNLIFDPTNLPFEPNHNTLKNGQTYESLRAIILYISMGYFEKESYLKQIYKLYEDQFEYSDSLGQYKDIQHKSSSTSWKVEKIQEENEFGIRSWRIHYKARTKYYISECKISQHFNYELIIGAEQRTRIDYYAQIGSLLIQEGKEIRLVLFKNYKGEGEVQRQELQRGMEFGCFIVFDNALKAEFYQSFENLQRLKDKDQHIFQFNLFTKDKLNKVSGFQHILHRIKINYDIDDSQNLKVVEKVKKSATSVISSSIFYQRSLLSSDLSISIHYVELEKESLLPLSDISMRDAKDLKTLLSVGHWIIQARMQTLKKLLLLMVTSIATSIMIGQQYPQIQFQDFAFWTLLSYFLFIILPFIAVNIISLDSRLQNYTKCLNIVTVHFLIQKVLTLILLLALVTIIKATGICEAPAIAANSSSPALQLSNTLLLRVFDDGQTKNNCENLPIFFMGSVSVLINCVYSSENQWRQSACNVWKVVIFVLYILVMHFAGIPHVLIISAVILLAIMMGLKLVINYFIGPYKTKSGILQTNRKQLAPSQQPQIRDSLQKYL